MSSNTNTGGGGGQGQQQVPLPDVGIAIDVDLDVASREDQGNHVHNITVSAVNLQGLPVPGKFFTTLIGKEDTAEQATNANNLVWSRTVTIRPGEPALAFRAKYPGKPAKEMPLSSPPAPQQQQHHHKPTWLQEILGGSPKGGGDKH